MKLNADVINEPSTAIERMRFFSSRFLFRLSVGVWPIDWQYYTIELTKNMYACFEQIRHQHPSINLKCL